MCVRVYVCELLCHIVTCVSHIKGARCGGTVGGGDDNGYQRNDLSCVLHCATLHCGGDDQRKDLGLQEIPLFATVCYIVVFCVLLHCGTYIVLLQCTTVCYIVLLCVLHCGGDGGYQRNDLILNQIFCDKTAPAAVDCDCADDDYTDDDDDDDDDTDDDDGLRTFEL